MGLVSELYWHLGKITSDIKTHGVTLSFSDQGTSWITIQQIVKQVRQKSRDMNDLVTSAKHNAMNAHNDLIDTHKCLKSLNIILSDTSSHISKSSSTIIECMCSFLPTHIITLYNNRNDANTAYNIAIENAEKASEDQKDVDDRFMELKMHYGIDDSYCHIMI
jgi:hypothetical protein